MANRPLRHRRVARQAQRRQRQLARRLRRPLSVRNRSGDFNALDESYRRLAESLLRRRQLSQEPPDPSP